MNFRITGPPISGLRRCAPRGPAGGRAPASSPTASRHGAAGRRRRRERGARSGGASSGALVLSLTCLTLPPRGLGRPEKSGNGREGSRNYPKIAALVNAAWPRRSTSGARRGDVEGASGAGEGEGVDGERGGAAGTRPTTNIDGDGWRPRRRRRQIRHGKRRSGGWRGWRNGHGRDRARDGGGAAR